MSRFPIPTLGPPGRLGACRSLLFPKDGRSFFPKDGRCRLNGLPIEEIINAGPCVDLSLAHLAFETARMLVWMLLLDRSVIHPAIGAAEIFGRPYAAGHPANMRPESVVFQSVSLRGWRVSLRTGSGG